MKAKIELVPGSASKLTADLRRRRIMTEIAARGAVHDTGEFVFAMAQETVPRLSGALAASGSVIHMETGHSFIALISYGTSLTNPDGVATRSYAVKRHEMLNTNKPASYKWLERALINSDEIFLQEASMQISQALR